MGPRRRRRRRPGPADVSLVTGAVGVRSLASDGDPRLRERGGHRRVFARIRGRPPPLGERFAPHVVDGSPVWRIVRCVPVRPPLNTTTTGGGGTPPSASSRRRAAAPGSSSSTRTPTGSTPRASSRALADSSGRASRRRSRRRAAGSTEGAAQRCPGRRSWGWRRTRLTRLEAQAPAGTLVFQKPKTKKPKKTRRWMMRRMMTRRKRPGMGARRVGSTSAIPARE